MNSSPDAGRRPDAAELEIPDDVATVLRHVHHVVVPTDAEDPALARARQAALHFGREYGVDVVLYDRSDERWTDTPHPSGPWSVNEIDGDERPHLIRQMDDFRAAGVSVTAWLSSVPALTAMIDVIQQLRIDCVVLPQELGHPKLMDRIKGGSDIASMIERFAELQLPKPPIVVVVPEQGPITHINTEEKTS